jgi:hypothetical protein
MRPCEVWNDVVGAVRQAARDSVDPFEDVSNEERLQPLLPGTIQIMQGVNDCYVKIP